MKIAIDLHGTLDKDALGLGSLISKLIAFGNKIVIMSGGEESAIRASLCQLGMWDVLYFVEVMSVAAWCRDVIGIPGETKKSPRSGITGWYCDDTVWWASKSMMCAASGIDVIIDDKREYEAYFGDLHRTKFVIYKNDDGELQRITAMLSDLGAFKA